MSSDDETVKPAASADSRWKAESAREAGGHGTLSVPDLEAVIGALPVLLFLLDAGDVIAGYRIGGRADLFAPPERFLGHGLREVLPEHPGRELAAAMAEARATGGEVALEYSLPMAGGPRTYDARIVPLAGGRVAVLVVDVTERARDRELLATRLRQQSVVAQIGQHATRVDDLHGLMDAAVRAVASALDVELTKVLEVEPDGQTLLLVAGEGWKPGLVGHARVGTGPESQAGYTLRADAPVVVHDLGVEDRFQGPPLLEEHGAVSGLSVVIGGRERPYGVLGAHTSKPRRFTADDTLFLQSVANILAQAVERHQILTQLRESEQRLRLLIDRSADVIAVFGAGGTIGFMSAAVEGTLGFRPDEMVGRSAFDYVHPEDRDHAIRSFGQLARSPGGVAHVTMRHRHRDGTFKILESSGTNLLHVPAVAGIVVSSRDVSERRSLEEQLGQSQRLESVGRLAGGLAHDLNNILTVVLGNAELMGSTLGPASAEREELEEIVRSSLRARDLVQRLLAFARKQVLAPKVLDLNRSIADSDRLLRRLLREDIVMRVHLADALWPVVADPAQIEQVLINLAVNARDAMPGGGTLTIETANVELSAEFAHSHPGTLGPGPFVRLSVSDSGQGMPRDVLAHAFEPFFTTKPQGLGTGLGLATTYGIVKQSGGHIYAESEVGVGSTFSIYFPLAHDEAAPSVESPVPQPRGGAETLLLVEDEAPVLLVTQRVLERAGYRVIAAATPEAALALEAGHAGPIHLLITDVVMAGMSGRQVAEELCRRRPALRVLYISGYADDAIVHHGVVERGTWFLPKPFAGATLTAKVREVLDAGETGDRAARPAGWDVAPRNRPA